MADEGGGGVPDWILTYGDMMSLLLCFFVLLYSLAGGEKTASQDAMIESIIKQFGDSEELAAFYLRRQLNAATRPGKAISENKNATLQQKHANQADPGPLGDRSRVQDVRDGKRLVIGGPIQFVAGKADLTDDARRTVLEIAELLRGKLHMIEVRGFEPPALPSNAVGFRDPMDLAYARARAVTEFLTTEGRIRADIVRVSIAALVESETLNPSANGERMFDRVVISSMESSPLDFERAGP